MARIFLSENSDTHSTLISHGYSYLTRKDSGDVEYHNPSTKHEVLLKRDGSWVFQHGTDRSVMKSLDNFGSNHSQLMKVMDKYHGQNLVKRINLASLPYLQGK